MTDESGLAIIGGRYQQLFGASFPSNVMLDSLHRTFPMSRNTGRASQIRARARRRTLLAFFLVILASVGCAKEIKLDYRVPTPLVDPLPLTVGVFYDEEFRNYHLESDGKLGMDISVRFGPASVKFYDDLFAKVFAEVVLLEGKSLSPENVERIDMILEPRILRLNFWWVDFDDAVDVTYSYTLYSPAGKQLAHWRIDSPSSFAPSLDEAFKNAMRDAGARFIVSIHQDPLIHRCLSSRSVVSVDKRSLQKCFLE